MDHGNYLNLKNGKNARNSKVGHKVNRRLVTGLLLVILVIVSLSFVTKQSSKIVTAASISKSKQQSQSVCIDPGHGGDDPGAQSGNLTEATINLQVAFTVQDLLKAIGHPVYMTRTTNVTLSHAQRAEFCNAHHASILVAIHQNDYSDPNVDYSTALYYKPQDLALANALANAAGGQLGLNVTPPMYFVGGVLMHSTMPATLIESLFITNTAEATAFNHSNRINQEAQGIVKGIVSYFSSSQM
jgi:N-acetylmuramoyl-L-alanine amidase